MRFVRALALAATMAIAPAAFADKKSEAYVETKANDVLQVLNDEFAQRSSSAAPSFRNT